MLIMKKRINMAMTNLGQMVLNALKERLGEMTVEEARAKAIHYEAGMNNPCINKDDPIHQDCADRYYDFALYADLLAA